MAPTQGGTISSGAQAEASWERAAQISSACARSCLEQDEQGPDQAAEESVVGDVSGCDVVVGLEGVGNCPAAESPPRDEVKGVSIEEEIGSQHTTIDSAKSEGVSPVAKEPPAPDHAAKEQLGPRAAKRIADSEHAIQQRLDELELCKLRRLIPADLAKGGQVSQSLEEQARIARQHRQVLRSAARTSLLRYQLTLLDTVADGPRVESNEETDTGAVLAGMVGWEVKDQDEILSTLEQLELEVLALEGEQVPTKPRENGGFSRPCEPMACMEATRTEAKAKRRAEQALGDIKSNPDKRAEVQKSLHAHQAAKIARHEQLLDTLTASMEAKWGPDLAKQEMAPQRDRNPRCTSESKNINLDSIRVPQDVPVTTDTGPRGVFLNVSKASLLAMQREDLELTRLEEELSREGGVACQLPVQATTGDTGASTQADLMERTFPAQTSRLKNDTRVYQSMKAVLQIGARGHQAQAMQAIVDSGAAWSSINRKVLEARYPELMAQASTDPSRRFVDASGRLMPSQGYVWMHICVGAYCFWTRVYVFDCLGVDFLLGVNSLCDGDLVIRARQGELLSLEQPSEVAPLICGSAPCAKTTMGAHLAECVACIKACGAGHVMVDRSSNLLRIGGVEVPCERVCSGETLPVFTPPKGAIELYASQDMVIHGKEKAELQRPEITMLPAVLQRWVSGPEVSMIVEPSPGLMQNGLATAAFRHSSMEGKVFIRVSKSTVGDTAVRKGDFLGYAYTEGEQLAGADAQLGEPGEERVLLLAEFEDDLEVLSQKPYADGGPPVTDEDYADLGLDLTQCINPLKPLPGGGYEAASVQTVERLKRIATRWWLVWSRDTRAPRLSRLVTISIPTGNATPIAQKPYPIPVRYHEAVKKEIQKLLDAGLIEPGIGNWASPTMLTVKKDSTAEALKIKLVIDYRMVNSVTIKDQGGLGNQEEILRALGGKSYSPGKGLHKSPDADQHGVPESPGQKFMGIGDLASGFYQFPLANDGSRERSAFILPSSMGGTLYNWTVAPYGLARNPSSFSRGVQYSLQWMDKLRLAPLGQSAGGVHSWIDDIIFHADSEDGFMDIFERICERLVYCGLTLKAEKTELLRAKLEVLGYIATPEGLEVNPKKVEAIDRIPYPTTDKEVLSFMGAVNFYRRFLPRVSLLAKPLSEMLKKGGKPDPLGVKAAVDAIKHYLKSSSVLAAPDYADPNAEFVVCTDASEVAIGGVLMQWQWEGQGPSPQAPAGLPKRSQGDDPLNNSWRLAAGYKLKTIRFYSKTLDDTQARYNVFDKEGGAILMSIREFADEVTGYPTTVYTDSIVAASMLTKYKSTTRLQRWGLELMQYLPQLKIGFRQGVSNGCADLLSRFPYFVKYIPKQSDIVKLPDDLFERVAEAQFNLDRARGVRLKLTVGKAGDGPYVGTNLKTVTDSYQLYELRQGRELKEIWQNDQIVAQMYTVLEVADQEKRAPLGQCIRSLALRGGSDVFFGEQEEYEEIQQGWDKYVQVFQRTHGRKPVLYDLYCGEGGFSRGARAAGIKCIGFDNESRSACKLHYENDPTVTSSGAPSWMDSGMEFHNRDVDGEAFWQELTNQGCIGNCPPPDIIHASPPCSCYTKMRHLGGSEPSESQDEGRKRIDSLVGRLQEVERWQKRPIPWQIENVLESQKHVRSLNQVNTVLLCGTMMGHHVFRERLFYCNYDVQVELAHSHQGKVVGERGIQLGKIKPQTGRHAAPNMYGVYSRRQACRGSLDEWHGALGHNPGSYSKDGISGVLPLGYGRYLGAQMVAHSMGQTRGMPVWSPAEMDSHQRECVQGWVEDGYWQPKLLRCDALPGGGAPSLLAPLEVTASDPVQHPSTAGSHGEACDVDGCAPHLGGGDALTGAPDLGGGGELERLRSAFEIGKWEQRQDPKLSLILAEMEHPESKWHKTHVVHNELLYAKGTDEVGEELLRLCVPAPYHRELMYHFHFGMISGHRNKTLYTDLASYYYWENMKADCESFVLHCRHCQERADRMVAPRLPMGETPVGKRPYEKVHIDLKGPLRSSGGSTYILVVVDSFTRYTLYIPLPDKKADTVFRAMFSSVFCVFGMPYGMSVVSDNGTEFKNELQDEMSKYLGYRKIHVAPWNPQANGLAEAGVKRVKLLLDRHTNSYRDWHKLLPAAQYLLNTSKQSGTGKSAFAALFGRVAPQIPELENADLRPNRGLSAYARSLDERLRTIQQQIAETDERVKAVRRLKAEQAAPPTTKPLEVGATVWMLFRNKEHARRIRKSGGGDPWRHRYRIDAINDYTAKLTALDGAPEVSSWQPLHKISSSPPVFIDDEYRVAVDATGRLRVPDAMPDALDYAPRTSPFASLEQVGAPPHDDGTYDVEDILGATKRGGVWYVTVKWAGWRMPTEERRKDLLENAGEDVQRDVRKAVASARLGNRHTVVADDSDEADLEAAEDEDDVPQTLQSSFLLDAILLSDADEAFLKWELPVSALRDEPDSDSETVLADMLQVDAESAVTEESDRSRMRRVRSRLSLLDHGERRKPGAYARAVELAVWEGESSLAECLAGPESFPPGTLRSMDCFSSDASLSRDRWRKVPLARQLKLLNVGLADQRHFALHLARCDPSKEASDLVLELFGLGLCPSCDMHDGPPALRPLGPAGTNFFHGDPIPLSQWRYFVQAFYAFHDYRWKAMREIVHETRELERCLRLRNENALGVEDGYNMPESDIRWCDGRLSHMLTFPYTGLNPDVALVDPETLEPLDLADPAVFHPYMQWHDLLAHDIKRYMRNVIRYEQRLLAERANQIRPIELSFMPQFNVKQLNGYYLTIDFMSVHWPLKFLYEELEDWTKIPRRFWYLQYGGYVMDEKESLQHYGVGKNSIVWMIGRVVGGMELDYSDSSELEVEFQYPGVGTSSSPVDLSQGAGTSSSPVDLSQLPYEDWEDPQAVPVDEDADAPSAPAMRDGGSRPASEADASQSAVCELCLHDSLFGDGAGDLVGDRLSACEYVPPRCSAWFCSECPTMHGLPYCSCADRRWAIAYWWALRFCVRMHMTLRRRRERLAVSPPLSQVIGPDCWDLILRLLADHLMHDALVLAQVSKSMRAVLGRSHHVVISVRGGDGYVWETPTSLWPPLVPRCEFALRIPLQARQHAPYHLHTSVFHSVGHYSFPRQLNLLPHRDHVNVFLRHLNFPLGGGRPRVLGNTLARTLYLPQTLSILMVHEVFSIANAHTWVTVLVNIRAGGVFRGMHEGYELNFAQGPRNWHAVVDRANYLQLGRSLLEERDRPAAQLRAWSRSAPPVLRCRSLRVRLRFPTSPHAVAQYVVVFEVLLMITWYERTRGGPDSDYMEVQWYVYSVEMVHCGWFGEMPLQLTDCPHVLHDLPPDAFDL